MRFLLLALLLSVGCAEPTPTSTFERATSTPEDSGETTGFDPQAWLAEARELHLSTATPDTTSEESGGPEDPLTLRAKALSAELDVAVGWKRACDTYIDSESGAAIYEPTPEGGAHWVRGLLDLGAVSENEAVVAITCDFGAYQGSYALVHIRGDRATLLRAPALNEEGQLMDAFDTTFSTPEWSGLDRRTFSTFGRARGLGDCGTFTTYALASGEDLTVQEVRQRECGDEIPDPLPEPEDWPVVYTAQ